LFGFTNGYFKQNVCNKYVQKLLTKVLETNRIFLHRQFEHMSSVLFPFWY